MCIDYRGLNSVIAEDKFHLHRMEDLFDRLQGAHYLTSFDLQAERLSSDNH